MKGLCKIMVADDEPRIRRGLRNAFEWKKLGYEYIGEAEDGLAALDMAIKLVPDVLLVDINMPFVNGLNFVEQLQQHLPRSLVIIITGYDEFVYAQKALQLGVFDYLLKPVNEDHLYEVLMKAKEQLITADNKDEYFDWAYQQLKRNLPFLRQRFLGEWFQGRLSEEEIQEQLGFLNMQFGQPTGLIVLKKSEAVNPHDRSAEWNRQLLSFAIQNVAEDLLGGPDQVYSCRDPMDHLVIICRIGNLSEWKDIPDTLTAAMYTYLKQKVEVAARIVESEGITERLPQVYEEAVDEISKQSSGTPIVIHAKNYIDNRYGNKDLCLREVAGAVQISPSYLSRLLRQELGLTFNDYLTQIRVKHAIWFLQDPTMKIYEVAERVGYSTQHYFSTAFKKLLGISPIEYRKGEKR
jgi:two-component system response regulator YesN